MFPVMTRRQAADAGLKRYYTGKPCVKGHDSQRFTSTGVCIKCAAGYTKNYNAKIRQDVDDRLKGRFIYPLHPDDVATVLALCQGLDLQRGRTPWVPKALPQYKEVTADDLENIRVRAFGAAGRTK